MCGRFALKAPPAELVSHFGLTNSPDYVLRYNIAPSVRVPVIREAPGGERVADLLRWGLLPHWSKDSAMGAKLNNARAESASEKPSFRSAYRRRRCIVPASGFYEWQPVGEARKQPWYISLKGDVPMAMGGLWESWTDPASGEIVRTFCVMTTAANEIMVPIHDRMPVILRPDAWAAWLSPATGLEEIAVMTAPASAAEMQAWMVSRKVSNVREEGAEMIEPLQPD